MIKSDAVEKVGTAGWFRATVNARVEVVSSALAAGVDAAGSEKTSLISLTSVDRLDTATHAATIPSRPLSPKSLVVQAIRLVLGSRATEDDEAEQQRE